MFTGVSERGRPLFWTFLMPVTAKKRKSPNPTRSRIKQIRTLLSKIQKDFKATTPKATLADFIRLTQLERELDDQEQPEEIIIRWEEPREMQDTGK